MQAACYGKAVVARVIAATADPRAAHLTDLDVRGNEFSLEVLAHFHSFAVFALCGGDSASLSMVHKALCAPWLLLYQLYC